MTRLGWLVMALAPVSASAGPCAVPPPKFDVLTAPGFAVSSGGGVVAELDDLAKAPAWRFEGASDDVKPHAIAPGLATIDLPAGSGWLTLDGPDHQPLVRVKHADKDAGALAAPDVASVVYASTPSRRGSFTSVDVTVRVVPKDAIALVVYGVDGVARSWGAVDPTTRTINVYRSGRCQTQPDGTAVTNAGDKVELAWLDASGRPSKPSVAVTVKNTP